MEILWRKVKGTIRHLQTDERSNALRSSTASMFYCRLLSRSIAAPRSGTAGVSGRAAAVREAEATETAPAHPEATAHAEARTEPVPAPVAVIETQTPAV